MLQIGFHLPLLRGGFCWLLSREAQIGGMLHLYLIFLKFLPAPHSISVAHSNWPSGSPSPLIARSSSSNCSFSLGGRPALGRVLVLPEFFSFQKYSIEATVLMVGKFQFCRICYLILLCNFTPFSLLTPLTGLRTA